MTIHVLVCCGSVPLLESYAVGTRPMSFGYIRAKANQMRSRAPESGDQTALAIWGRTEQMCGAISRMCQAIQEVLQPEARAHVATLNGKTTGRGRLSECTFGKHDDEK